MKTKHITIPIDIKRQSVPDDISVVGENAAVKGMSPLPSTSTSEASSSNNIKKIPRAFADLRDFVQMTKPLTVSKNKQLDEQLLRMVVKEYQPFSFVEDAEFKRFVHMLCPAYNLPTRKTLSNNILQNCFVETMSKVRGSVKMAPAVSLTMDSWTSINNESYLAVTAHFIDSTTELRTFLLDCSKMDSSHTSQELSKQIKEFPMNGKLIIKSLP
ncbi:hypothetical protein AVEN_249458-1 [Araneus ventricosus]|uniref:Uncharacterized protein n=2 Tax=Araneus ventricosus TaxID=182803 RepID=A0A4Y2KZ80_ARAVE|nr:hypothetical protein AVEN_249458-1 [Araneus ventricosus]